MVTLVNRAKVSTATTGTGTITLGAAESGYQSFADAGVVDTNVVRYVIEDGTDWEIGTGTYTATGTTLSRTVLESSNADAALNLTGSAVVYVSAAAEDIPPVLELYAENPSAPTAPSATGTNAVAIGSNASAGGTHSFVVGLSATDNSNQDAVVIGRFASASAIETIAIGELADAGGLRSVAIGYSADANGSNSIAIGNNPTAFSQYSIGIGTDVQANSDYSTAIGYGSGGSKPARAQGLGAMALGGSYASGTDSFAAAIANNTSSYGATGASSVAIGYQAKANIANGTAIGGVGNTAGSYATAIGGTYNSATGQSSFAIGEYTSAAQRGKIAFGASQSGVLQQGGILVLRNFTSDATPKVLYAGGSTVGSNQVILPNNSAYSFSGTIIARQQASAGSEYASWEVKGALLRDATAATTVLGNGIKNKLFASTGAAAWDIALTADTVNGGLAITVTGAAATNIRWVATVNTSEVTY